MVDVRADRIEGTLLLPCVRDERRGRSRVCASGRRNGRVESKTGCARMARVYTRAHTHREIHP